MALLEVEAISKSYPSSSGTALVVDRVSFTIARGQTLGVVGESGSGKSTVARMVLGLIEPTAGAVRFDGMSVAGARGARLRRMRRRMQPVFQDPYAALNPRMRVEQILCEPFRIHSSLAGSEAHLPRGQKAQRERVAELLKSVGLDASALTRYPHEFSGGQRQRINIARALALRPKLIVADEPGSALDVSVQAQVLNLMQRLQQQFGISYLLISHDLAVVNHLCDEVCVLHRGLVVERGAPQQLFAHAGHPYTQAL